MKHILIFILFMMPVGTFALPCPNGQGILYKGNSIDEVIKECGPPTTQHTNTRTLYTLENWTYNIGHPYDAGYSQMIVSFKNDKVMKIHISDHFWVPICRRIITQYGAAMTVQTGCDSAYNVASTHLCGLAFGAGDDIAAVESICGQPVAQTKQDYTFSETELTYGGDDSQTIVFQDGKLVDWK